MPQIRPFEVADWPAVWALLEPVFRAGETFPHDPAITEAEAHQAWVEQSQAVMVAVDGCVPWSGIKAEACDLIGDQ